MLVAVALFGACSSSGDDSDAHAGDADAGPTPEHVGATTRSTTNDEGLVIETTSTRADFVSAGNVLVTVSGPDAADAIEVTSNGEDVTAAFGQTDAGWRGLVEGLDEGENEITATSGDATVSLAVLNHPKNGPVFSGPHLEPWICTTEDNGLGAATDDDCDAPTQVSWSYQAAGGNFLPLESATDLPADAGIVEVGGAQKPFVIRSERGVIDRGVYSIDVLELRPTEIDEWSGNGWNGRLVYRFGGGCGTGYSQGAGLGTDLAVDLLARGYAVATNTLDTFQTACNDVLSAEAALMTREHFIENYGVPEFTIGDGGSGGAIQQLLITHNYPGVLDAISAGVPFPDAVSISGGVSDCGLLGNYFESEFGAGLTPEQRTAIYGHATSGTCESWVRLFLGAIEPFEGCDGEIPDAEIYDPETNPAGVRCTLSDINRNVLGTDPDTGFANRPLDNVGVQYGLNALNSGAINVDEFLDLNDHVGGYDIDGQFVAEREAIDEETAAIPYRTGRIIGAGPLQEVPIILRNLYTDAVGDIHTRYHSFSIRERLRIDGEDYPNLLLWTLPIEASDLGAALVGAIGAAGDPIALLDEWLTSGAQPAAATQRCFLADGTEISGGWEIYDTAGPCTEAYPTFGDSRTAAGSPVREDIVKCALAPVDTQSYEVPFTDAQAARLAEVFPEGVCDWTQPGIGQQSSTGVWQTYGT
ncbi:MAG: DUF6351 family protein [Actinomycetota bacterium]